MKTILVIFLFTVSLTIAQVRQEWERRLGTGELWASDLIVDASGNQYLLGATLTGYSVTKFNSAGVQVWTAVSHPWEDRSAWAMTVDPLGNVYVTGHVQGVVNSELAVSKYNRSGELVWSRQY